MQTAVLLAEYYACAPSNLPATALATFHKNVAVYFGETIERKPETRMQTVDILRKLKNKSYAIVK